MMASSVKDGEQTFIPKMNPKYTNGKIVYNIGWSDENTFPVDKRKKEQKYIREKGTYVQGGPTGYKYPDR